MNRKAIQLVAFFFSIILILSCARFNTFYHAKQTFQEEEIKRLERLYDEGVPPLPGQENRNVRGKSSSYRGSSTYKNRRSGYNRGRNDGDNFGRNRSSSTGYDRVVEKCAKLITLYPQHELVDEAIVLMGKAYLRQGDYESALRKFDELSIYYPQSPYIPEAEYNKAYAYYLSEKYDTAISNFISFIEEYPKSNWVDDAYYYLANSYFALEGYSDAASNYGQLIYEFPKSQWVLNASYFRGFALYRTEKYGEALIAFKQVLKLDPSNKLETEARFQVGRCNFMLGEYELAQEIFFDLLKEARNKDNVELASKSKLKIAQISRYLSTPGEAMEKLREVIKEFGKTDISAEAQFEIAEIYQTELDSLEKAKDAYDKVRQLGNKDSELAQLALERSASITQLKQFSTILNAEDEAEIAKTQFLLAELYYFQMGKVDSAIIQYKKIVEKYPHNEYAAKSVYSLAKIYEDLDKSDVSDEYYQKLIDDYPQTVYANRAREKFGLEPIELPEKVTDKTLFLKAEDFLDEGDADSAKYYYKKVLNDYPESEYGAKSTYALAWIYDKLQNDPQTALTYYQTVKDSFPDTELATAAKKKIATTEPETEEETPEDGEIEPEPEQIEEAPEAMHAPQTPESPDEKETPEEPKSEIVKPDETPDSEPDNPQEQEETEVKSENAEPDSVNQTPDDEPPPTPEENENENQD